MACPIQVFALAMCVFLLFCPFFLLLLGAGLPDFSDFLCARAAAVGGGLLYVRLDRLLIS